VPSILNGVDRHLTRFSIFLLVSALNEFPILLNIVTAHTKLKPAKVARGIIARVETCAPMVLAADGCIFLFTFSLSQPEIKCNGKHL
jgi:hypothetical protein